MTITEFITARLDEWEATARPASGGRWFADGYSGVWSADHRGSDKWEAERFNEGHSLEAASCGACGDSAPSPGPRCIHFAESYRRNPLVAGVPAKFGDTATDNHAGDADHIAANDPAHVLSVVARLREIVTEHSTSTDMSAYVRGRFLDVCNVCVDYHADIDCENKVAPCPTLRALAAIWLDHDDYDEGWKP